MLKSILDKVEFSAFILNAWDKLSPVIGWA